jgi:hypothetical protein
VLLSVSAVAGSLGTLRRETKMKRRRLLAMLATLGLAAVVFFVLGGGGASGARSAGAGGHEDGDGHGCTNASLKGPYSYEVTGAAFAPDGTEVVEVAAVGLFIADGRGHTTGHDWASQNGVTTPRTLRGTYTIDPDCTGTAEVVFTPPTGPALVTHVFLALAEGGRLVKLVQTDPGTVASGEAIHQ